MVKGMEKAKCYKKKLMELGEFSLEKKRVIDFPPLQFSFASSLAGPMGILGCVCKLGAQSRRSPFSSDLSRECKIACSNETYPLGFS